MYIRYFLLFLLPLYHVSGGAQTNELPNILWITSEDNSPFLGCYGDELATTPNLDQLAAEGVTFDQAFATTPVCAPSRFTIITGTYGTSRGTANMRSAYPISEEVKFYPKYLREKGYYTTNRSKKDYNTIDQPEAWDESSNKAHYHNRPAGKPFFHITNITTSHESSLHRKKEDLYHRPGDMQLPPYHPDLPEIRYDWAQYYDKVMEMDKQVGEIIAQLKADGLYDKTIIFYYSDHGGVLTRSKRYLYESGLKIPFIVRIPPAYQHLFPGYQPGSRTDRMISFVDLAPTLLSIIGIPIPDYMQGRPFMGREIGPEKSHIIGYADRMDERVDMSRTIRTKKFRYNKHFMPDRPCGRYLHYLWIMPTSRAWEEAYQEGNCNPVQRQFFEPKPDEQLFDIQADPHNVNNLAGDPEYMALKDSLADLLYQRMLADKDLSIIPETMRLGENNLEWYQKVREGDYPYEALLEAAWMCSNRGDISIRQLKKWLKKDAAFQYWTLRHLVLNPNPAYLRLHKKALKTIKKGPVTTRIAGIRYLYSAEETQEAQNLLRELLDHEEMMVRAHALDAASLFALEDLRPFQKKLEELSQRPRVNYDGRISIRYLELMAGM